MLHLNLCNNREKKLRKIFLVAFISVFASLAVDAKKSASVTKTKARTPQSVELENTKTAAYLSNTIAWSVPLLKTKAASQEIVYKINKNIMKSVQEDITQNCDIKEIDPDSIAPGTNRDFSLTSEILTDNTKYFSFTTLKSFSCGGSDFYAKAGIENSYTYNLKTGNRIDLKNEFFSFKKAAPELSKMYIAKLGPGIDEACVEPAYTDFSQVHMAVTNEELILTPAASNDIQSCIESVKIPLKELKALLKPESVFVK